MIKVIRVDQFLLIGEEGPNVGAMVMQSPRIISINQQGQLMLTQMIGNPKDLVVNKEHLIFSYTLEDEGMIASYREAVTGLVIARPGNVVDIKGVR